MYNFKIITKEQFSVIGYSRKFNSATSYEQIPLFFDEVIKKVDNKILDKYGICYDCSNNEFKYMIADDYNLDKAKLQNIEIKIIPKNTWIVFSCEGELPKSIQDLNTFIFNKWLPNNKEYMIAGDYNIEFYDTSSNTYSEIWIPIIKNI